MPLYDWLSLPQTRQAIEHVKVMLERRDGYVDRLDISAYAAEGLCAVMRCTQLQVSVPELARLAQDGTIWLPTFEGGGGAWGRFVGWRTTGLSERRIRKTIEQARIELRRPERYCPSCGRRIPRGRRTDTVYCGSGRCYSSGAVTSA